MPKPLSLVAFALSSCLLFVANQAKADQSSASQLAENTELENTQKNLRDKDNTTLTAEDQNESKADLKITAHIRKALLKDKSLSMDAHNAKIITRNGVVTLRGAVATTDESIKLQKICRETAGVVQVDNQLETKAP
ncbi:BON domain-containing protein [Methylomonas sp. MO1]|uniref:BON domain-containing protein n=1 Tax=Methylomonas sp. MO1 TaxID=3073619 RepID=UPI0028A39C25|nr:BON domain-containing protein [Methylomonas sp. MO1]MDT4288408.1 BON domain-containing protein [Methylomonas sp. MO1]